jgi:thymidylate synthase
MTATPNRINRSFYGEEGYLDALRTILQHGKVRKTRNAETISMFHLDLEFDVSERFPLLTTKRVFWKGVVEELLWFIRGDTDANKLAERGVHIWDGNTSREYLDSIGLNNYREGECGPIYGYQWRHFNKPYVPLNERKEESSETVEDMNAPTPLTDQLQTIINELRTNPTSRRLFMSAWNPEQMTEMCLPCCHVSYQFFCDEGKLSCHMTQRSGDMFLGVPFNIASTSLLLYIISNLTGMTPDRVYITIGDAHIYCDHIDAVNTQLERKPYPLPKLLWNIQEPHKRIEDYKMEDFVIEEYQCHPTIKAKMVA